MTQFEPPWNPYFSPGNPLFDDLRALFGERLGATPPDLQTLQGLLDERCRSRSGAPLQLIDQTASLSARGYEHGLFETGHLPAKTGWHDLFNVLIWSLFPDTKSAINQAHVVDCEKHPPGPRSRRRDALTLLDECGILLASCDPRVPALHARHRWQELFVQRRGHWRDTIRAFVFGHGLYEQCLNPYRGLTGKALHITVSKDFFDQSIEQQYNRMDSLAADQVDNSLDTPNQLLPLPVLGVPGWWAANSEPDFYLDSGYFRPASGQRQL